jgi:hypothetical protein
VTLPFLLSAQSSAAGTVPIVEIRGTPTLVVEVR